MFCKESSIGVFRPSGALKNSGAGEKAAGGIIQYDPIPLTVEPPVIFGVMDTAQLPELSGQLGIGIFNQM